MNKNNYYNKLNSHNIDPKKLDYIIKYKGTDSLDKDIDRLINNEPIQYIVGNQDFLGNIIKVDKRVLIPRFETELLVDKTIKYAKKIFNKKINILDIGTGSGCIAISLKKELNAYITGIDISSEALELAKENAILNNVEINFYESNLFNNITSSFDIIISNPPYISYDEDIMDIVKNNEPHLALYAANNGLYFYEEILKNISNHLNKNYLIAFEIGYKQYKDIENIIKNYLPNSYIKLEQDYSQKDRCIFITNIALN